MPYPAASDIGFSMPTPGPLLLFDGVCTLCDRSIQFVLDHEPAGEIRFASLQSEAGRAALAEHGLDTDVTDSVVFIDQGRAQTRSDAALAVAARLDTPWRWLGWSRVLPRSLRDHVYDWVARNRYRWFGTRASCRMPNVETRARFLDADELAAQPPVADLSSGVGQT